MTTLWLGGTRLAVTLMTPRDAVALPNVHTRHTSNQSSAYLFSVAMMSQ